MTYRASDRFFIPLVCPRHEKSSIRPESGRFNLGGGGVRSVCGGGAEWRARGRVVPCGAPWAVRLAGPDFRARARPHDRPSLPSLFDRDEHANVVRPPSRSTPFLLTKWFDSLCVLLAYALNAGPGATAMPPPLCQQLLRKAYSAFATRIVKRNAEK